MNRELEEDLDELLDTQLAKSERYVDEREDEAREERQREREDPMYDIFGLGTDPFFAARYGAGLQTSIHRNIGTFLEKAVQLIIGHSFNLSSSQISYSMTVVTDTAEMNRTLDCYVDLADLSTSDRAHVQDVLDALLEANPQLDVHNPKEIGFEIKGCEKSQDSGRAQRADNMGRHLVQENIFPVFMLFCTLLPEVLQNRYSRHWLITQGEESTNLLQKLTGVDFMTFLQERRGQIRRRVSEMMVELTQE